MDDKPDIELPFTDITDTDGNITSDILKIDTSKEHYVTDTVFLGGKIIDNELINLKNCCVACGKFSKMNIQGKKYCSFECFKGK